LEPCTVFVPTGRTCECSQLCLATLFLAALIQDGDVARVFKASLTDHGLRSDLAIEVTVLLAELDGLARHDEPLKDLVWNHEVSCITRSLRCLIADVVLRTADEEISVADEMYVPEEHALRTCTSGTPVPVAAVARFVQALGLRATLLFDFGGTMHRHDIGVADAPFLGGLLVRDGHMSAIMCEGHAPAPMLALAPRPISIHFGEDGATIHLPNGSTRSMLLSFAMPVAKATSLIAEATGLPAHEQRLVLDGVGLAWSATQGEEGDTLRNLGAWPGSELRVLPYPLVGGRAPERVAGAKEVFAAAEGRAEAEAATGRASSATSSEALQVLAARKVHAEGVEEAPPLPE